MKDTSWFTKGFVKKTVSEVEAEIKALGLPLFPVIEVIPSETLRVLGSAKVNKKNGKAVSYTVKLSRKAHPTPESVRHTIAHELLHCCKGCQNHGELWKRYGRMMEKAYGYKELAKRCCKMELSDQNIDNYHYFIKCASCGYITPYVKRANIFSGPADYTCGVCRAKGKLHEITKGEALAAANA